MTLDDMLVELDMVDFPEAGMRELAKEKNIQTVDELREFIRIETLICDVGDKLPPEVRQLGKSARRESAIHLLRQFGNIPNDYV